jgi:hypothetical protein
MSLILGLREDMVKLESDHIRFPNHSTMFEVPTTFTFFGGRLETIHNEMQTWRPQSLRHLLKPGYKDRFSYYTQMFALFIAVIGLVSVVLSIIQTAYTIKGVNIALASFELQRLQLLNSTGA